MVTICNHLGKIITGDDLSPVETKATVDKVSTVGDKISPTKIINVRENRTDEFLKPLQNVTG